METSAQWRESPSHAFSRLDQHTVTAIHTFSFIMFDVFWSLIVFRNKLVSISAVSLFHSYKELPQLCS